MPVTGTPPPSTSTTTTGGAISFASDTTMASPSSPSSTSAAAAAAAAAAAVASSKRKRNFAKDTPRAPASIRVVPLSLSHQSTGFISVACHAQQLELEQQHLRQRCASVATRSSAEAALLHENLEDDEAVINAVDLDTSRAPAVVRNAAHLIELSLKMLELRKHHFMFYLLRILYTHSCADQVPSKELLRLVYHCLSRKLLDDEARDNELAKKQWLLQAENAYERSKKPDRRLTKAATLALADSSTFQLATPSSAAVPPPRLPSSTAATALAMAAVATTSDGSRSPPPARASTQAPSGGKRPVSRIIKQAAGAAGPRRTSHSDAPPSPREPALIGTTQPQRQRSSSQDSIFPSSPTAAALEQHHQQQQQQQQHHSRNNSNSSTTPHVASPSSGEESSEQSSSATTPTSSRPTSPSTALTVLREVSPSPTGFSDTSAPISREPSQSTTDALPAPTLGANGNTASVEQHSSSLSRDLRDRLKLKLSSVSRDAQPSAIGASVLAMPANMGLLLYALRLSHSHRSESLAQSQPPSTPATLATAAAVAAAAAAAAAASTATGASVPVNGGALASPNQTDNTVASDPNANRADASGTDTDDDGGDASPPSAAKANIATASSTKDSIEAATELCCIAMLYHLLGNEAEAQSAYRKVLQLQPMNATATLQLGRLLENQEEPAHKLAAIQLYERVLLLTADPVLHLRIGNLWNALGSHIDAIRHFSKGRQLDPGNEELRSQLVRTRAQYVTLVIKRQQQAANRIAKRKWPACVQLRDSHRFLAREEVPKMVERDGVEACPTSAPSVPLTKFIESHIRKRSSSATGASGGGASSGGSGTAGAGGAGGSSGATSTGGSGASSGSLDGKNASGGHAGSSGNSSTPSGGSNVGAGSASSLGGMGAASGSGSGSTSTSGSTGGGAIGGNSSSTGSSGGGGSGAGLTSAGLRDGPVGSMIRDGSGNAIGSGGSGGGSSSSTASSSMPTLGATPAADMPGTRLLQFARVRMTKKQELERRRREKEREEEEEQARAQQAQDLLAQLSTPLAAYQFVNNTALPLLGVTAIDPENLLAMLTSRNLFAPGDDQPAFAAVAKAALSPDNISLVAYAESTSLYPRSTAQDAGRPSSDAYGVLLYPNCIVAAVADGLDWGQAAQRAANRAVKGFLREMQTVLSGLSSIDKASNCLSRAFSEAHHSIVRKPVEEHGEWEGGTTTLLGGVLMEVREDPGSWMFVCASVGDCKAFHYSICDGTVSDITESNVSLQRTSNFESDDPGGMLGAFDRKNVRPDLRNLKLYQCLCKEGDFIIMTTDGVYDNYDPQYLGIEPNQLHCAHADWKSLPSSELDAIKGRFISRAMQRSIRDSSVHATPRRCVVSMLQYCLEATRPTREWMEAHPGKTLPRNYASFPGQLDHATCLSFRVSSCTQRALASKVDLWDFHAGIEELIHDSSAQASILELPIAHPVSYNVPISVLVTQTRTHVMVFCRLLARTRLEVVQDETSLILRLHRTSAIRVHLHATMRDARVHGADELAHPLERTVDLPGRVVPASRHITHDATLGLAVIRYAFKTLEPKLPPNPTS